MAYTDFKFFDPPEDMTNDEKIAQQQSIIEDLEMVYWKVKQDSNISEFELSSMENEIMAARAKFEDLGGTYE